jgi:hypothetical protein
MIIISNIRQMKHIAPLSLFACILILSSLLIIISICISAISHFNDGSDEVKLPLFQSDKLIFFVTSSIYALEGMETYIILTQYL